MCTSVIFVMFARLTESTLHDTVSPSDGMPPSNSCKITPPCLLTSITLKPAMVPWSGSCPPPRA